MRYDFSLVNDEESYVSVPEGNYACKIAEVRPGLARDGSERWSFRLEVIEGEYTGRTAAWDSLTWSQRGVLRVKKVLEVFGFEVDGEVEVEPSDLEDLRIRAEVVPEEWEDPATGRRRSSMRVPYLGYSPLDLVAVGAVGERAVDPPAAKPEPERDGGRDEDVPF